MKKTTKQFGKRFMAMLLTLVMLSTLIVPGTIVFTTSADEIPTYSVDTSWYDTSKSSFTLTTPGQVLGFFQLLATGTTYNGKTIYLGNDIDLNPGWEGNLTVSGTTATFPTAAPNAIYTGDACSNSSEGRWFFGTFNGQYHTLRGVYSSFQNANNHSGIFGAMGKAGYGTGKILNLRIENSYIEHVASDKADIMSSAICTAFRGDGARIENCYFDVDLAIRNANNRASYAGAISQGGGTMDGTAVISNVVYAGIIFDANGSSTAVKNGTTNGRIGMLYQNANNVSLTVTDVLNMGAVYCNLAAQSGNGYSNTGHLPSNISSTRFQGNWVKNSSTVYVQEENPDGGDWIFVDEVGSYLPAGAAELFIDTVKTRNTEWDYSGSTLHITSVEDLLQFIYLADTTTNFSGKTIYLDCDIAVNRFWSAAVEIDADNGELIYPDEPLTAWTNVGSCVTSGTTSDKRKPRQEFAGTFDGQGHTISGIYAYRDTNDEANYFAILFNKVNGGTVKNLAVKNSIIIYTSAANNSESCFGGLIGGTSTGTLQNIYTDLTMVMAAASGKKNSLAFGGITGWFGGGTFENSVFAGNILTANAYKGNAYPATGVTWVIGGATGEQEGGTTRNLLGIPRTVLVNVPNRGIQEQDQKNANNSTGGYNPVIAGHYSSDYGTRDAATVLAGPQLSAPAASWKYVTTLHTYVPGDVADTFFAGAIGEPPRAATVTVSNATVTVYEDDTFADGTVATAGAVYDGNFYFSVDPDRGYEVASVSVTSGTYDTIEAVDGGYAITGATSDLAITVTMNYWVDDAIIYVGTVDRLLDVVYYVNHGDTTFSGQTIYLTADLDVNPGWDATVEIDGETGTGLANSTGTATIPSGPSVSWPNNSTPNVGTGAAANKNYPNTFNGTFDGQGHTISGIRAYKNSSQSREFGLLFNNLASGATVRNLAIVNSTIILDQNSGLGGGGLGGVVGVVSSGATASNIYSEVNVVLRSNNNKHLSIGGIAGWSGGTISNCVYNGTIVTTSAQDSSTYPATTANRHIGGITGESEGGSVTDCIGIVTFAVKESYVTLQSTDQATDNGGANAAVAGHYESDYGTLTRVMEGKQKTEAPASSWKYVYDLHSYVPGDVADTFFSDAIGGPVPDWLYPNRGEALLGTAAEVMAFIDYAQTHDFEGITVKLTADIDLNPGWSAKVTGTTTMTFPTEPDNVWTPIPMFKGSFDGQGYTLKGVYSYAESDADSSDYGGMFYDLENATIQNLRITNAFIGFKYTGAQQDAKQTFGGLAYRFLKRTVIRNVVFDAEVWNITDGGKMFGMLAVYAQNGDSNDVAHCPLIDDVVIMGRQALALTDGTYGSNVVNGSAVGAVFVNTNWWRPSISDVLVLTSFGSGVLAASGGTNNINWSVPLHRDTLTGAATVKYGVQDETSGWTYSKSLHSYVMNSVYTTFYEAVDSLPGELVVDCDIMDFTEDDYAGSSYIVDSLEDWEYFVELANSIGTDGMANMTIKLGADINFNTFDVTETVTNFTTAQSNVWTVIDTFKGTLDGQGHKLSGIYSRVLPTSGNYYVGGLFNTLDGATITNLVITNSFIGMESPVEWADGQKQQFGGFAHTMQNGTTISNVLFDAEVFARHTARMVYGGIAAVGSGEVAIENFVFAGTYGYITHAGVYNYDVDKTSSGDKLFGYIFANGAGTTITLTDVLVLAERGVYNMSAAANAGEDGKGYLVHWSNGNTTLDNAKIGAQAEAVGTWSYNESLGSYAPVDYTVTLHTYTPKTRTDAAISTFDSRDSGSYTVASVADLELFSKIGVQGYTFAGDTVKLTADIDFNSGWVATPTVENGTVTFPTEPDNVWTQIPNFYGTLDGQGHAISGLYRYATGLGESGSAGGIFLNLVGAMVKDLVITNSFFAAERTGWGSQNQKFGGLARSIQGATTIQNLFFNAEVWFKTDTHRTAGMLAAEVVNDGANLTVRNVVLAGRFGHVKNDMTIAASSGSSAKGVIAGNANNKTITLDQVLVAAEITLDAVKDTGTKLEKTVHYGPGGVAGLDTLYYGLQAEQIGAWTWDGNLVSYSPTTLTANYIRLDVDAPLTMFNELAKPGSSYVITSMQDLLNFMQKINASSGKGAGYIFKLTADIDLNPGWRAEPTLDGTLVHFPTAPTTSWQLPRFDGTFDGQGHYVAGIYRTGNTSSTWSIFGGFCDYLRENGTIKNTKFINGLVIVQSSVNDVSIGGVVGQVGNNNDSNGAHPVLDNLYVDMHVYMGYPDWGGCEAGGLIGQAARAFTVNNCTFAGSVGLMWNDLNSNSNVNKGSFSGATFRCPPANNSGAANQVIGDYGAKSGSVISNVVLAGTINRNSSSSSQTTNGGTAYGLGRGGRTGTYPGVTNVLVGKYATLSAAESAGAIMNESSPAYTAAVIGNETFLVTTSNYNMGLTGLPDGRPTTQSIQAYAPNTFYQGSVFTIANSADLLYAAELSQSGVTFSGYTLKLTADIDLNPGWDARIEIDGEGNPTIPPMPTVIFPGFKSFYGTIDGQDHTISGIAMYKLFTKNDNLGFVEFLYGNIRNLKFNNGLIFAQTKNYNQSDSKIGGVAARIQSANATLENLYVDLNVWYQSGSAHRIGGIAAKTENGAHLVNITFAGVVGTMKFSSEGGTVPSQSTGLSISQLVADGNWKSALYITNCNMNGTVYASSEATNPTDSEISSNINATNVSGTGNGTYTGSSYSNNTAAFNIWPTATVDRYTASYEADTMTKTYYFETITRANFTAYIAALEAAGYTVEQNYSIGDSAYYLLQNGIYTVYASRIPSNGYTGGEMFRARVFVEPYGRDYNTNKTATAKSTYCAAQLWQVNVDNWYNKSSGGACYIMRLTDGRFLIVDSGFGSSYEGDNIYKILYENNVRDGDPIVAGWFFTHAHEDHVKGFERFVKESHLNDITVEAFYFNFASHEVGLAEGESGGDGMSIEATTATRFAMTAYPNAKVYSRVHSGQSFGFADATVTVLYTHEDASQSYWKGTTLYKNELKNGNDTSVMYQVKIGDEKILFTGDAYVGAENAVYYTFPASSYASKFVTVSHHGYEGLSKTFYQAVNPTVALWPMDLVRYVAVENTEPKEYEPAGLNDEFSFKYRYEHSHSGNRMWEANHWFNTASSVKEVIPSFENACLTLPYTAKSYSGGNKTVGLSATYNSKANNTSKWDGAGGAGITINEWYDAEADELHITSRKDLFDFMKAAQKGRTFAGQTVILDADISANPSWAYTTLLENNFFTDVPEGLSVWQPIPNFAGTFDGQGHTIRNLYIPITVSHGTYNGGFIKSLTAGATITNLIIKSSAMVATYNADSGSHTTRIGAFIGRIVDSTGEDSLGPVVLNNLYIDLDGYFVSGAIAAFTGLVGTVAQVEYNNPEYSAEDKAAAEANEQEYTVPQKLTRTAQFVIENVAYAGDLICVAKNGQAGGTINIASGQQMWGPVGFIGKSDAPKDYETDLTAVITNAIFLGELVKCSNGSDFRAGILSSNTSNFGFNTTNVELTDAYANAAAANAATPEGWTYFGRLESYIPDDVFAMLDAVASPVKAQQTDSYTPAGKTYEAVDVRFVGILNGVTDEADLANYSEVGMKIKTKRNGTVLFEQELTTSTVYVSIWAGETLYEMEDAGGFLYAFVIKGIPLTQNIEFYITTFTVDADTSKPENERKVYAEEQMFVYDGGLVDPNAAD